MLRRLTLEELSFLKEPFVLYLSTHGIDAKLWEKIQKNDLDRVEHEVIQFSQYVWNQLLVKLNFFELKKKGLWIIVLVENSAALMVGLRDESVSPIDFTAKNIQLDSFEKNSIFVLTDRKELQEEENLYKRKLIEMGYTLTDQKDYHTLKQFIK